MTSSALKSELDIAIKRFEKQAEFLQSRGMDEDSQEAINILSTATLNALRDFRTAILAHCD